MRPSDRMIRPVRRTKRRKFDVQPSRDDRSLDFPMRAALPPTGVVKRVRKVYRAGAILDQGQEGACVGHGWTGDMLGSPERVVFRTLQQTAYPDIPHNGHEVAFWWYHEAQKIDDWAGEDYEGTSVLAGAKIARNLGLIDSYRWAHTRADFVDTIITTAPVVIAVPWFSGSYDAPGGEVRVSGSIVGGHCLIANGYDPRLSINGKAPREMVRLCNSWGKSWGVNGQAWIALDTLWAKMLDTEYGEMCVPLGETALSTP